MASDVRDSLRTTLTAVKDTLASVPLIGSTFAMTLMLAGASYAADKIALICSDANGKDDYSLSIDLDRKLASFHMSAVLAIERERTKAELCEVRDVCSGRVCGGVAHRGWDQKVGLPG